MKKALFIAEKPNVAKDVYDVYKKMSGFYLDLDFTSAAGHLVSLVSPDEYGEDWAEWKLDTLPMFPSQWKYKVCNPKFYKTISDLVKTNHYDYIINACDSAREGELIFYNIYNNLGLTTPVLRYWVDDCTEAKVISSLNSLKPEKEYEPLKHSAMLRAYLDWLIGMNFSRAASIKTNIKGVHIGRVMTPALSMIVSRYNDIQNFVSAPFYEVVGNFTTSSSKTYQGTLINPDTEKDGTRFLDKDIVNKVKDSLSLSGVVSDVKKEKSVSNAPKFYNMGDLQKDCSRLFKLNPSKTMEVAQALYDTHKLISYPRTDSVVLSSTIAKEIPVRLQVVKDVPDVAEFMPDVLSNTANIDKILSGKVYVNDSGVSDHHAIIPTEKVADFSKLSDIEIKVYSLIVKRMVAIFMPPNIVEKTTVITTVDKYNFKTLGKVLVQNGWKDLYPNNSKDSLLPSLSKGEVVDSDYSVKEGKTTPPKLYNYATIIDAMESAGRTLTDEEMKKVLIACEGLGTSATRDSILKNLISAKYVTEVGKDKQDLEPTPLGVKIISLLENYSITSPILTAQWEKKLKEVQDGSKSYDEFYAEMQEYISTTTDELKENLVSLNTPVELEGLECPFCKGKIIKTSKAFFCENISKKNSPDGCTFALSSSIKNISITEGDVKDLINNKRTKDLVFDWGNGKTSTTFLMINDDNTVGFPKKDRSEITKCRCGGDIIDNGKSYFCINFTKSNKKGIHNCDFAISKTVKGVAITPEDILDLVANGKTSVKEFTINDKKVSTNLILQGNNQVTFPVLEEDKICTCPSCGRDIVEGAKSFYCAGFRIRNKKNEPACSFALSKSIKGETITKEDLLEIINTGKSRDLNLNGNSTTHLILTERKMIGFPMSNSGSNTVVGKCPLCKGDILDCGTFFKCSNYKKTCNCSLSKDFYGSPMTFKDLQDLYTGVKITRMFTWKTGRSSEAEAYYDKKAKKISFNFK